ncbi:MAG: DUF2889 domain-containing protein [Acidimicrobiales bacterium]|nr:DUF2889 domain-containing protein [Acidimicrobiales bacterium]
MSGVPVDPEAVRRPGPGPHDTVERTPPVPEGGARRTTSTAVTRPDGPDGRVVIELGGRDVVRETDGTTHIVDEIAGRVGDDGAATAAWSEIDGGRTVAPDIVGLPLAWGWGRALADLLPAERTLLASVLEDLGGAFLVSGYAPLRSGLITTPPELAAEMADGQADVCLGWARGGDLVTMLATTGQNPVPQGPAASTDVLAGWHPMPEPPPHTVRRLRRLDVAPDDDGLAVQSHFRDSYVPPDPGEPEMVMHEYLIDARVDSERRLADITVEPRVLPWRSCPGAIHSAQQLVGVSIADLDVRARTELRGPTTCTHLTSTMRSMADVACLAAAEPRGEP